MGNIWQEIRYKVFHSGSRLNLLIGINILIFLLINIPAVIFQLFGNPMISGYADDFLRLPSYLPKLIIRFWTPFTYMFMHDGILHILFNMLWLYWMGQIFEEYLGTKRIVGLYILGGLAGAAVFVLSYNTFPAFAGERVMYSTVVGASASVMAIVVATATLLPDYTIGLMFIGPVKLKWVALAYVLIDFLGIIGPNAGGEIAHLGGALFGFIYIKQLKSGHDWAKPIEQVLQHQPKVKVAAKNQTYNSPSHPEPLPRQEEVDRILDKISLSGYDSLSKQERETLHRASKHED